LYEGSCLVSYCKTDSQNASLNTYLWYFILGRSFDRSRLARTVCALDSKHQSVGQYFSCSIGTRANKKSLNFPLEHARIGCWKYEHFINQITRWIFILHLKRQQKLCTCFCSVLKTIMEFTVFKLWAHKTKLYLGSIISVIIDIILPATLWPWGWLSL
jgi:hypothetical protein